MCRRSARCSEKTSDAWLKEDGRERGNWDQGLFATPRQQYGGEIDCHFGIKHERCARLFRLHCRPGDGVERFSITRRNRFDATDAAERSDDTGLRQRLKELALERRRFGYRRLHILLKREGWLVNHKRLYRLYCEEGLVADMIELARQFGRYGYRRIAAVLREAG